MKSNINSLPLRTWPSIQYYWENGNIYGFKIPHYPKASPEIHIADGWRDYVAAVYDPTTHKKGELIHYVNPDLNQDFVTDELIAFSPEELEQRQQQAIESEKQSKQAQLLEEKKTEQALTSFQLITDEAEALAVKEVYPDWSVEEDYLKRSAGYKVTRTLKGSEGYEVRLFSLIQPHTPQDQPDYYPENFPAGWSEIKMQGEVEVWTQPTGGDGKYVFGAVVTHKGQTWENIHPAPSLNVWEPGVFGWQVKT